MQRYKYKRLKEEQSLDKKPTKIRKQLNSSERWRAKREIQNNFPHIPTDSEISEMRYELEIKLSTECSEREIRCPSNGMSTVLKKLDLDAPSYQSDYVDSEYDDGFMYYDYPDDSHLRGTNILYECKCPDVYNMTDEEVMKRFGYN